MVDEGRKDKDGNPIMSLRTVPAVALCDHEAQPNLFFRETEENQARIQE
jgi:hypothetical protein